MLAIRQNPDTLAASMKTPKNHEPPQPPRSAHNKEASNYPHPPADTVLTGKPTLHGDPPAGLKPQFAPAVPGQIPEFSRLPSPRERCPYTGASRSWLIDQANEGK